MKTRILFLTIAISLFVATSTRAQGSFNFVNSANSLIQIQFWPQPPHAATVEENTFVEFLWAPVGVTDFSLFQVLGSKVKVGVPVSGRFSGGVRTIPAGTGFAGIAPGATVNALVRAWFGAEDSDWNTRFWGDYSTAFTVDTGDTTSIPLGTPGNITSSTATPFTGVIISIPEPATGGLLALAVFIALGNCPMARRFPGKH